MEVHKKVKNIVEAIYYIALSGERGKLKPKVRKMIIDNYTDMIIDTINEFDKEKAGGAVDIL